jgi:hypothetical protein
MTDHFPERDLLRSLDPAPRDVQEDARVRNLRVVLEHVAEDPTFRRTAARSPR